MGVEGEVFEIGVKQAGQCVDCLVVDPERLQEVLQRRAGIHVCVVCVRLWSIERGIMATLVSGVGVVQVEVRSGG